MVKITKQKITGQYCKNFLQRMLKTTFKKGKNDKKEW